MGVKKAFAFIGSPLKEGSNTAALAGMLMEELAALEPGLQYEIVTAGQVGIRQCGGCWSCMAKGECPLDKGDDMRAMKQKMLEADLVVWGSPLYVEHVSGQMKTFLDRLATWYHTIRLAGKIGCTVCTTGGGSILGIQEYLQMLLKTLGVKVVAGLDGIGYTAGMLIDPDGARSRARECAARLHPYLTGGRAIEADDDMERVFQAMKSKVTYGKDYLRAEYDYWKDRGMLELNSCAELLARVGGAACPPVN